VGNGSCDSTKIPKERVREKERDGKKDGVKEREIERWRDRERKHSNAFQLTLG